MNCKKGDMALVISGPNAGEAVTCIALESPPGMRLVDSRMAVWRVDRNLIWRRLGDDSEVVRPYAPDHALRPIGCGNPDRVIETCDDEPAVL